MNMEGKPMRLVACSVAALVLLASLSMVEACGSDTTANNDESPGKMATGAHSAASTAAAGRRRSKIIPQPPVPAISQLRPRANGSISVRRPSRTRPRSPTRCSLYPEQDSVLMVGHVDGKPFRTEVTLLPETRIIEWQGKRIETLVSQYMAYLDGRIQEVAYDLYAQADDGSVWYFGEDVADFEDGAIVTKEGTWIVGKDGPAAMIMPADPKVGDAYRTENTPGIAFEEVTVMAVGKTSTVRLVPSREGSWPRSSTWTGRRRARPSRPATASSTRPMEATLRPSPSPFRLMLSRAHYLTNSVILTAVRSRPSTRQSPGTGMQPLPRSTR